MTDAPTTPDPIEIAMEAEAGDTAPDSPARRVLLQHERLIRWQVANERAGFALRALIGLAGLALAGALGATAWSASQSDGLVVEPFSVPPQLAVQGRTGAVVASDLLDRLKQLDRSSGGALAVEVSDSWSQTIGIEVPRTGISLDQVDRLLRRWLGRQTYISGQVIADPQGVELSVRSGTADVVRIRGPASELPALLDRAAEQVYATSRPTSYAFLLVRRQDPARAVPLLEDVLATTEIEGERTRANQILGNAYNLQGRFDAGAVQFRKALAMSTRAFSGPALAQLAITERRNGRWEAGLAYERRVVIAYGSENSLARRQNVTRNQVKVLLGFGDYLGARREVAPLVGIQIRGVLSSDRQRDLYASVLSGLHEYTAARAYAASVPPEQVWDAAAAAQDWSGVLEAIKVLRAARPPFAETPAARAATVRALAYLGRMEEAGALAATLPEDCYPCQMARGEWASIAGDARTADVAFAAAIRLGPSLPFAEVRWGRAQLARGQSAAAIVNATAAVRKSPRFADSLELWAEALLAQGDARAAVRKFEAAAKFAPRWGRLHLKWGEALAKLGEADEARAKWRAAAGMDLNPADRAALTAKGV